ncbi:MAG: hypothetical protein WDA00_00725 [Eubacteriales bacterium]
MGRRAVWGRVISAIPTALWTAAMLCYETVAVTLAVVFAVVLHECGHLLSFSLLGEPPPKIRGCPGGVRILSARSLSYRKELLTALAGPTANLAAAALCLLFARQAEGYLLLCATMQLLVAAGNLLPIQTLDGGRALSAVVSMKTDAERAWLVCRVTSLLCIVGVLFVSLGFLWFRGQCIYFSFLMLVFLVLHIQETETV